MSRHAFNPEGVAQAPSPYSHVVISDGLVYTSGQTPFDENRQLVSEEFEAQAHRVFVNLGRCLEAAGCGFGDVLKVTTHLTDLGNFPVYNEIYKQYFEAPYPARTTIQSGLLGFLIEVEAVARQPS